MPINGVRSTFPITVDDFGNEFVNNICEKLTSTIWNKIQDATYAVEKHTANVIQTGLAGVLTHPTSGGSRPRILYKTYTITLTGSETEVKIAQVSGFTTAEKVLFDGTPLASGNVIHLALRRIPGHTRSSTSVHASLRTPIVDLTGDNGWFISCANMKQDDSDIYIQAGTYVLSVMITAG